MLQYMNDGVIAEAKLIYILFWVGQYFYSFVIELIEKVRMSFFFMGVFDQKGVYFGEQVIQ